MAEKNMIIAIVLSFLITGLGLVYDGLIKRGIVSFVIAVILSLLTNYVLNILGIFALLWFIYVLYDTYQCTKAINENQPIPLFLTQVDLQ